MTATAFALGRHLASHRYDITVNLGIAGSFDHGLALGSVVEVSTDTFSELGAEDDARFLPLSTLGFGNETFAPTARLSNLVGVPQLPQARAITVNTVHGNAASIAKVEARLAPQVESMEGAAFFYACHQSNTPCLQVRAISNYVEKRNREGWKIGPAIANLNRFAIDLAGGLINS
jgi:futalosine hydrolase